MKIILAYNPFGDIKCHALNNFLGRTDITPTSMAQLATGNDEEKEAFEKATKFFEKNNFRKHFEKVVPNECKFIKYDFFYQGALMDIAKNLKSFNEFFGWDFHLEDVSPNGDYANFKADCGATHLVGWLNDAISQISKRAFRDALNRNAEMKKAMNELIEKFKNGNVGIEGLYNGVNAIVNKYSVDVSSSKELSRSDAWSELRKSKVSIGDGTYDCYEIRRWEVLNAVASHTSWCVAQNGQSGRNFFDGDGGKNPDYGYIYPNYDANGNPTPHINDKKNAYYLFCKGTRPIALFNVSETENTCQFKGIDDSAVKIDRPSMNRLLEQANQLRKILGVEKRYDGDFYVFKNLGKNNYDNNNGNNDTKVEALDVNGIDLDKPDNELVENLRNNGGVEGILAIIKDLSLLDHKPVHDEIAEQLEYGKRLSLFIKRPDALDKYPDLGKIFLDFMREDSYPITMELYKNMKLLDNKTFVKAFLEINWSNEELRFVSSHDELFAKEGFAKKFMDTLDTSTIIINFSQWFNDYQKLWNNPYLKNYIVEKIMRNENLLSLVPSHEWLFEDKRIVDTLKNALKNNKDSFVQYGCFSCLQHKPSLLEDKEMREIFAKSFKGNSSCQEILKKNPSLLNDPMIYDSVAEEMKKGRGMELLINYPSFMKDSGIHNEFVKKVEDMNGTGLKIVRCNLGLLNYDDVRDAFVKQIRNGYFIAAQIVNDNPKLMDDPKISGAVVNMLKAGGYLFVVCGIPSLMKHTKIRDEFLRAYKNQSFIHEKGFVKLLEDKGVYDIFIEKLKRGVDWAIIKENPEFLERQEVKDAFVSNLEKGYADFDFFEINGVFLKDQKILDAVAEYAESNIDGFCYLVENHPSLFENEKIKQSFIRLLKRGDVEVLNELKRNRQLASDNKICKTVAEIIWNSKTNFNPIGNFEILDGNPDFLRNDEIRKMLVDGLEEEKSTIKDGLDGNAWRCVIRNPEAFNYDDVAKELYGWKPDYNTALNVISHASNLDAIKYCMENHKDGEFWQEYSMLYYLVGNDSKGIDESKLYEYCKTFDYGNYVDFQAFFKRFFKISDKDDFWKFVLSSNFVFEVVRDFSESIPYDLLKKLSSSDDEDIRWIASKKLKEGMTDKKEKVSKRIALLMTIPLKIAMETK